MSDDRLTSEDLASVEAFRAADYPRPAVTVDLVVFTIVDADLKLLLITRKVAPFKGAPALPGGFVRLGQSPDDQGEDLNSAAARELQEETGLRPDQVFLEQLYTFGNTGRDPRWRVISVAYFALIRPDLAPFVEAGGDAESARWVSLTELAAPSLAFDHHEILECALARLRGKIDYEPAVARALVPNSFSIGELRAVFDVIKGVAHDPGNFRRRFLRMVDDGMIEVAPGKRVTGRRPAKVYRFSPTTR